MTAPDFRASSPAAAVPTITAVACGLFALLALAPASGDAHVELRPKEAPAGETRTFRLVVENERDDAGTRKLDLLLPEGVTVKARDSSAGWRVRVRGSRVSIEAPAGERIDPHGTRSFPIAISTPYRPRARLTFKVLQEYDSGEIVRWIGPPDSVEPAPRVILTKPTKEAEPSNTPSEPSEAAPTEAPAGANSDGNSDGNGLLVAGIAAGGAGLLLLVAYVLIRRRRRRLG
jgi:uncharacterized protein YcnI